MILTTKRFLLGVVGISTIALGMNSIIDNDDRKIANAQKEISKEEINTEEKMKDLVFHSNTFENEYLKVVIQNPINQNKYSISLKEQKEKIITSFLSEKFKNNLQGKLHIEQKFTSEPYSQQTVKNTLVLKSSLQEDKKFKKSYVYQYFTDNQGNILNIADFVKTDVTAFEKFLKEKQLINQDTTISNEADVFIDGKTMILKNGEINIELPMKIIKQELKEGYYQKQIALTFDDGPSKKTLELLEILEKYDAKATFFVLGNLVEKNPDITEAAYLKGHQIGAHSWKHDSYSKLSDVAMKEDFKKTSEIIKNTIGKDVTTFRPPYGAFDDNVKSYLTEQNVRLALWDVDTMDWKNRNANAVAEYIIAKASEGHIVLMHDLYPSTVAGTDLALAKLKEQGYVFVTMDELY